MCRNGIHYAFAMPPNAPLVWFLTEIAVSLCVYMHGRVHTLWQVTLKAHQRQSATPGIFNGQQLQVGIAECLRCIGCDVCVNTTLISAYTSTARLRDTNNGQFCMLQVRYFKEIWQTQLLCSRWCLVQELRRCRRHKV